MSGHYAQYGNTLLIRDFCRHCQQYALVLDNAFQCCGRKAWSTPTHTVLMSSTEPRRLCPKKRERDAILTHQNNHCIYCGETFGHVVLKGNDVLVVSLEWDHLVPFSYTMNNHRANFVAACSACNRIKTNHIFENINDARIYIQRERERQGFERLPERIGRFYESPTEGL